MKKKLLGEANLTFERAIEIAIAAEKAEKEAKQMTAPVVEQVHKLNKVRKFQSKSKVQCTRCGLTGHVKDSCRTRCFKCKKVGHTKKNCFVTHRTHQIENDSPECQSSSTSSQNPDVNSSFEWAVSHVKVKSNEPLENFDIDHVVCHKPMVEVTINDDFVLKMEFDSGSSVSVTTVSALERAGVSPSVVSSALVKTKNTLKVANGEKKSILGKLMVDVTFRGKQQKNMELYVVDEPFPSLLGRTWIEEFCGIDWLERLIMQSSADTGKDHVSVLSNVTSNRGMSKCSVVRDQSCNSQCTSVNVLS